MKHETELQDKLNKGLTELYVDVSNRNDIGADRHATQRTIDKFLGEWSLKLYEDEQQQIRDSRKRADEAQPELGPDRTIEEEKQRAKLVNDIHDKDIPVIQEQMSQLRDGLIQGIRDISEGREPTLIKDLNQEAENSLSNDKQRKQAYLEKLRAFDRSHGNENER